VIIGEVGHELDAAARDGLRDDDGLAVPGSAFIYAVARELGIDLADVHHATVGGVVVELLGRVPEPGDAVELDGVRLEVTDVQHDRVKEVRIVPAPAGRDAGSS
jgi:putative hemolysin